MSDTNAYAQYLETFTDKMVHLVAFVICTRHLESKNYKAQCLETLIGNLVYLVPFLVDK